MTRSPVEIEQALALKGLGFSATQIARDLRLPRSTVRDWLIGHLPRDRRPGSPGCPACRNDLHDFAALGPPYAYLLGLYLGDGCISSHARGVYKLRLTLDAAYPGIIEEAAASVRTVRPESKVGKMLRPDHSVEVWSYSKSWPCLFPQHGPGKKHARRIWLSEWQLDLVHQAPHLLLRGLIHSDGCRFINTGRGGWSNPRYSFTQLSMDIRRIFTDTCDLLGLGWTSSGHTIYVSRKADVARMDKFIGPKA